MQSIKVVDISFVVQKLIPVVLATKKTPQLCVDTVVDAPLQVVQIFPVVVQRRIPVVQTTRRTTGITQFFFDKAIDATVAQVVQIFPVVVQMPIPMVQTVRRTMEIPQFVFDKMIDIPVVQVRAGFSRTGRQHPCREAEVTSHGLSDHRDSPVSRWQGDRRPCCAGRASSTCAVVEETAEFGVSTASCGMKLAPGAGRALCTGTGPGLDTRHQGGEGVADSPGV